MKILKSHGTLFLASICWSTFTPKYLRINNDDKSLFRITNLQRQKRVSECQERIKGAIWFGLNVRAILKLLSVDILGIGAPITSTSQDLSHTIRIWALSTDGSCARPLFAPIFSESAVLSLSWCPKHPQVSSSLIHKGRKMENDNCLHYKRTDWTSINYYILN